MQSVGSLLKTPRRWIYWPEGKRDRLRFLELARGVQLEVDLRGDRGLAVTTKWEQYFSLLMILKKERSDGDEDSTRSGNCEPGKGAEFESAQGATAV